MESSISKKATWGYLLKFTLPSMLSMLIMSTFGIVDGIFVSRLINPIALSAVGIVFPFISFAMAIGFMLGVGGNALVAKKIGAGLAGEARANFTLIALTAFALSLIFAIVGIVFPGFILHILGADDFVSSMAFEYLKPILYFMPAIIVGMVFQQFLITEGKANIVAMTTTAGGFLSAGLNYLFIYLMGMGLRGAAIATCIGYTLPAVVGLVYFTFKRNGHLCFVKPKFEIRVLGKVCVNGSSEMVTMLATSVTTVLMNNILMGMQGVEAVAAASIMFGAMGVFGALFAGYSSGVAPIISYNYGKGDTENLKRVYANSLRLIGFLSIFGTGLAWLLTNPIISVYDVPVGTAIHDMAFTGFRIITAGFVFMGFNMFSSMMFTALNNGLVSALLSFFRTLVFVVISFLILPRIFGLNGAWAAMPFAELLGLAMTIFFFKKMKKVYHYA